MSRFTIFLIALAAAVILVAPWGHSSVAGQEPVEPAAADLTLAPGESADITKTVQVPERPPKADVYFLADTTGSMGGPIASVKASATDILTTLEGTISDVQFGAGDYKDFPFDVYAFQNAAPVGSGLALDAIAAWTASGGNDGPEGQLFPLDQVAEPTDPQGIAWRDDSARILVWFGDAPGHDPICSAISGLPYDITEASATAKLVAAGIVVVAISTTTGFGEALDADPGGLGDYSGICGEATGTAGQASRITAATDGVHILGVTSEEIVEAILEGIAGLSFTVTMTANECDPLVVEFEPASHPDVEAPAEVEFVETVSVPEGTAGGTYSCTVDARVGGAVIGSQTLTVTVPGEEPEPSPEPIPTAVAEEVQEPVALPETGGAPGGGSALGWMVAIAAALVLLSGLGLGLAYARRRVR